MLLLELYHTLVQELCPFLCGTTLKHFLNPDNWNRTSNLFLLFLFHACFELSFGLFLGGSRIFCAAALTSSISAFTSSIKASRSNFVIKRQKNARQMWKSSEGKSAKHAFNLCFKKIRFIILLLSRPMLHCVHAKSIACTTRLFRISSACKRKRRLKRIILFFRPFALKCLHTWKSQGSMY